MFKRPRLKYCYHAEFLEENRVLLLSEKNSTLISGELSFDVLQCLPQDGVTIEQLISQLADRYSYFDILTAITQLAKDGYLTYIDSPLPHQASVYWNSIGIHTDDLLTVLEEKPVSVECLGDIPREVFEQAFTAAGVKITRDKAELRVIILDDYQQEQLREINQEALDSNQTWMPVKPCGSNGGPALFSCPVKQGVGNV